MKKIELTEGQKRHSNIQRVKKVFQYENLNLVIAEVCFNFDFRGKKQNGTVLTVLAPNGGSIPIGSIYQRETLKSIQERTITALNDFAKRGCDVRNELTRTISL